MARGPWKSTRGVSRELRVLARGLRREPTRAEAVLWEALKERPLDGLKFRRQHAVATYVVDFYCTDRQLVVEVDGEVHNDPHQRQRDLERTAFLEALGSHVLRLTNAEVTDDLPAALSRIRATAAALAERAVPPSA